MSVLERNIKAINKCFDNLWKNFDFDKDLEVNIEKRKERLAINKKLRNGEPLTDEEMSFILRCIGFADMLCMYKQGEVMISKKDIKTPLTPLIPFGEPSE